MRPLSDILLTATAPVIWGTTYFVTTRFLPSGHPVGVSLLRALPVGLLLLVVARKLPLRAEYPRILVLGGLNIALFLVCLFIAAYRLPGGVAATVGATQPLIAIFLARIILGNEVRNHSVVAAVLGVAGVALLVLSSKAALDPVGLGAGLIGSAAMATGNILAKKWKRAETSHLAFTSWQLVAGGLFLLPLAIWLEPAPPKPTAYNVAGILWLSLVGAALTYVIWFRGVARMSPASVSALLFLSPITAVSVGWLLLGQKLTPMQLVGMLAVFLSVSLSQVAVITAAKPLPNVSRNTS